MDHQAETKYNKISIDLIDDPELAIRSDISPESVEELSKSIKQIGLIEPIVVKKKGSRYEVIAGHRRLLACRMAEVFFVPCRIIEADDEMTEVIKAHENLYREEINVVDEAHFIEKTIQRLNLSVDKMASLLGKSRTYVQSRLAILGYPDFLYQALKDKKISFSVARKLSVIDDLQTLRNYVEYASLNGITEDVAVEWVKRWKMDSLSQSGQPVETIEEQGEIRQTPRLVVVCAACHQNLEMKDAKVVYMHYDCYRKISEG
jgi:ParB family chromosome partitioning protein